MTPFLKNILIIIFILILLIMGIRKLVILWANHIKVHSFTSSVSGPHILIIGSTHGDEQAGYHASMKLIQYLTQNPIKKGKVTIIPKPNKLGLHFNSRYMLQNYEFKDLNRNYKRFPLDFEKCKVSSQISQYVTKADFIIDLHEGYNFAIRDRNRSIGSGIYPANTTLSKNIVNHIIEKVNVTISDPTKKFITFDLSLLPGTLRNYCNLINKDYFLVETTGKLDVQPLSLRTSQQFLILKSALQYLKLM